MHEFVKRLGEELWVGWLSVGSGEDVDVGLVAVELGVLGLTVLAPGVQDFDGAGVEVDRSAGCA